MKLSYCFSHEKTATLASRKMSNLHKMIIKWLLCTDLRIKWWCVTLHWNYSYFVVHAAYPPKQHKSKVAICKHQRLLPWDYAGSSLKASKVNLFHPPHFKFENNIYSHPQHSKAAALFSDQKNICMQKQLFSWHWWLSSNIEGSQRQNTIEHNLTKLCLRMQHYCIGLWLLKMYICTLEYTHTHRTIMIDPCCEILFMPPTTCSL